MSTTAAAARVENIVGTTCATTNDFLATYGEVLRGDSAAFAGLSDRVNNARYFASRLRIGNPTRSKEIAREILADLNAASAASGLHPDTCAALATELMRA